MGMAETQAVSLSPTLVCIRGGAHSGPVQSHLAVASEGVDVVKHGDEVLSALPDSQTAWHLHCLHQHLSQLLAQLEQHCHGPGLLRRGLQWAQRFPVLPRKVGCRL